MALTRSRLLLGILVASGGIEATAVWPMEYIKVSERSARILEFFLDIFSPKEKTMIDHPILTVRITPERICTYCYMEYRRNSNCSPKPKVCHCHIQA